MSVLDRLGSAARVLGDFEGTRKRPLADRFFIAGVKHAATFMLTAGLVALSAALLDTVGLDSTKVVNERIPLNNPMAGEPLQFTIRQSITGSPLYMAAVAGLTMTALMVAKNSRFLMNEPVFRIANVLLRKDQVIERHKSDLKRIHKTDRFLHRLFTRKVSSQNNLSKNPTSILSTRDKAPVVKVQVYKSTKGKEKQPLLVAADKHNNRYLSFQPPPKSFSALKELSWTKLPENRYQEITKEMKLVNSHHIEAHNNGPLLQTKNNTTPATLPMHFGNETDNKVTTSRPKR